MSQVLSLHAPVSYLRLRKTDKLFFFLRQALTRQIRMPSYVTSDPITNTVDERLTERFTKVKKFLRLYSAGI